MPSFEEQHLDVLQNIELAIISVYRENPSLLDYDVDKAINALWKTYRAEEHGRTKPLPPFSENQQLVYERVKVMCDWRLGCEKSETEKDRQPTEVAPDPLSLDAIMACLKRIRKSIEVWTKDGGRQGYLYFIDHNSGL